MPVINRIAALADGIAAWRHDIHRHPEIGFEVRRTAGLVAEKLRRFGCDAVVETVGRTGVVGLIHGRQPGSRRIGLRADMDALPILESTGKSYASSSPGTMHACGHDGHSAMLLGAARYLAETRNFAGTVVLIFQPAEEISLGAKAMLDDGLMTRFAIEEVYGLHTMPGVPAGHFAICAGPILAAVDFFTIDIEGRGAHAAAPHLSVDAVYVASQIVASLQVIVARNIDPLEAAVVSTTAIKAGDAFNVLPQTAALKGTVRTLNAAVRDFIERRLGEVAEGVARLHGAKAVVTYDRLAPATYNHAREAAFAAQVARSVAGTDGVNAEFRPVMAGEDFAYMLEARPGAFAFIGNGASTGLHTPDYDFADEAIAAGVSYWARLAEMAMPIQ